MVPVSILPKHLKEIFDFSFKSREEQERELSSIMHDWEQTLLGDINRILTHEELLNRSYYRGRFASPRYKRKSRS